MEEQNSQDNISQKDEKQREIKQLIDNYYNTLNDTKDITVKIEFHIQGKKTRKQECQFSSQKTIAHVYNYLKNQKEIWDILSKNQRNLMIYVNDKFVPAPNARLGNLLESFSVGNQKDLKLQVYTKEIFG